MDRYFIALLSKLLFVIGVSMLGAGSSLAYDPSTGAGSYLWDNYPKVSGHSEVGNGKVELEDPTKGNSYGDFCYESYIECVQYSSPVFSMCRYCLSICDFTGLWPSNLFCYGGF